MHLYSLTLQKASGIVCAINGCFSGDNTDEILVARGKILDLLRLEENGEFLKLLSVEVFGSIRSLGQFRLTGSHKDYIIVVSDSGRIVILDYQGDTNVFHKLKQETLGKPGCLRTVPGQYMATDPKGRAVMIGACVNQKIAYVFTKGRRLKFYMSNPFKYESNVICYSICGVDRGFNNPIFAAIEDDYSVSAAQAQKCLVFYELDLVHKVVSRKWSEQVDNDANMLITVPGGGDGPSGVLVCVQNFVLYKNLDHQEVRGVIPRRQDLPEERGVLIVSAATHKKDSVFFFLLQSEYGDIFKVTLQLSQGNDSVKELKIKYFDTIPVSSSLCVLGSEFLFAASEFGNHALYRFKEVGDVEDVESLSNKPVNTELGFLPLYFQPRELRNLTRISEAESLMPIIDMKVDNLFGEETPQIFTLCGRGPRSTLRILRPGLAVDEVAISDLPPEVPTAVWTVKKNVNDEFDAYIFISFATSTMVLSIGEIVEEVDHLDGFLKTTSSLAVSLIGTDSLLQVHSAALVQIRESFIVYQWPCSKKKKILKVGFNRLQVVVALSGGKLHYFQVGRDDLLVKSRMHMIPGIVACLNISPVPHGKKKSMFVAVGSYDSYNNFIIHLVSLEPKHCMNLLSMHRVTSSPESLVFLDYQDRDSLFLNVGLQNGELFRIVVNSVTGKLSDGCCYRLLGQKAPKLFSIVVGGTPAMLCLSNRRTWLGYMHKDQFLLLPLSYLTLECAAPFSSEQCREGAVAVTGTHIRIFTVAKLRDTFNETSYPLRYTPRKLIIHQQGNQKKVLVIIERDQGVATAKEREDRRIVSVEIASWIKNNESDDNDEEDGRHLFSDEQYGYPKAESDTWVSCIRVFDPDAGKTTCLLELQGNEAAFSLCTVNFKDGETMLAVGTGRDMRFGGNVVPEVSAGYICVYRFRDGGRKLELLHKTEVNNVPLALCNFNGKLLAGVGQVLLLFDLGGKELLRKRRNMFSGRINSIHVFGDRIYVGDETFRYCKYLPLPEGNQLYMFAEDSVNRSLIASHHIDIDTMVGSDRFGNVFFVQLHADISNAIEKDPTRGCTTIWKQARLEGTLNKVDEIVQFHVGDVVTCFQKSSLIPGARDCVLYGTMMGSLGALHAFTSRKDVEFFTKFEIQMREMNPPLCGRDHLIFRSSYSTVKNVIDGDLCEQFPTLPKNLQQEIAGVLDTTPDDIIRKVEDIRKKII